MEQSSAGYHTLGNNFKYKYFREFETEFKNILGVNSGTIWVRFMEKTRGRKSRATVPLNYPLHFPICTGIFTKATSAGMKGFPKAAGGHMNEYLKGAEVL
jgi:hypothetical protein